MLLSTNYFLLPGQEREVIIHGESGLRVNVFSLENEAFTPSQGELHIFGDDHGEWLAFETEGWHTETLSIFSNAVLWYAMKLDYPEMKIITEDPRPPFQLRII